jgi:GNAT superfamily N-acetyltransferase
VLGADVAELPALAVRPELEGNGLGRLLLALLESAVMKAGVKLLAMPALVPFPSSSPKQADMAAGQPGMSRADAQEPVSWPSIHQAITYTTEIAGHACA